MFFFFIVDFNFSFLLKFPFIYIYILVDFQKICFFFFKEIECMFVFWMQGLFNKIFTKKSGNTQKTFHLKNFLFIYFALWIGHNL